MVTALSLSASATYAVHDTPESLFRPHPTGRARSGVQTPARAGHPSRSKKAIERGAPRMQKLDVMTKLAMWGVDVDRMREGRVSRSLDDTELSTSSSSLADRLEFVDATPQTEQVVDSAVSDTTAAVQSVSSIPTPESDDDDPSSASARLASLIHRENTENWPTVGTEAWSYARTRIVSASEASTALGLDRFRTPEKLIADKLDRLDAAQGVDAETLSTIAALNPGYDPDANITSLGWRARGGKGKKQKKKRKSQRGGVGGQRGLGSKPSVKFMPPAVVHGNDFEPVARLHYQNMEGNQVHEFGLKIHDTLSWLGATPDGVTVVNGTEKSTNKKKLAVVEIKCPYTRPVLPVSRAKEHFPQLQVLLQVFGADECHFVQYKPPGIGRGHAGVMNEDRPLYLREVIKKDDKWWAVHKPKLEQFHLRLEKAMCERDERLAQHGWRGVNDGGEIDDWEEDLGATF